MKKLLFLFLLSLYSTYSVKAEEPATVAPSYAWGLIPPLGLHCPAEIDTLLNNYSLNFIPSLVSHAYATTGNYGAEGLNMLFFDRPEATDFYFMDALAHYLPSEADQKFYNTRIPMTLLSYNFGGGKEVGQDRLQGIFSGNVNQKLQVGAMLDYLYSKGSYANQAVKHFNWGLSGSYIGDRFEFQGFYNMYNSLNKENGGIVDDLYITDPAEIQGGDSSVDFKTIPTNLSAAHNRIIGGQLYLNSRYKVGFWRDKQLEDTVVKEYVPVSSFIWTLDIQRSRHMFRNDNAQQGQEFWENRYFSTDHTLDNSRYMNIRNTFGISLLEGFNKYAKAGAAIYLTHEYHRFRQPKYAVEEFPDPDLTPLPIENLPDKESENQINVGIQLTKQQGRIINYEATADLGVMGASLGEFTVAGNISSHIPLMGDTVGITAFGHFCNLGAPYFMEKYISNHFIWDNDFGMTRRFMVGGELSFPKTGTTLSIAAENIQNMVYFDRDCLPAQDGGNVQVVKASLQQNFKFGIFSWHNSVTYQTTSNDVVIPLPRLVAYTNLFINFRVAKALDVQLGMDCDYYTKYMAVDYQPATMAFYNQRDTECGNYPFINFYVNMKLSRTRFYIMFSHVNQGMTGSNYFSMPHYPLNPRRFQLGLSVNFAN